MASTIFSSKLSEDDISIFLHKCARLKDCKFFIVPNSRFYSESYKYFSCEGKKYLIIYSDFSMRICDVAEDFSNPVDSNVKVGADDWFCFLRAKFGQEYVSYYAEVFNAESIICGEPQFISKVSFDELEMILRQIGEVPEKALTFREFEIIEVQSFYQSERRFLVVSKYSDDFYFLRVSDFSIIEPRFTNKLFHRFMIGKFGKEYIDAYEQHVSSIFSNEILPKVTKTSK